MPLRPGERQQQLSAALAAGTAPRVSVRSLSPWQLLQAGWGGKGEKLQEENATRRSGSRGLRAAARYPCRPLLPPALLGDRHCARA